VRAGSQIPLHAHVWQRARVLSASGSEPGAMLLATAANLWRIVE
jgi:hypothetical protein